MNPLSFTREVVGKILRIAYKALIRIGYRYPSSHASLYAILLLYIYCGCLYRAYTLTPIWWLLCSTIRDEIEAYGTRLCIKSIGHS